MLDAVHFWLALWNSIFSSTIIAASVVIFSTLAGWAFAKLRFRGSKGLLIFVVATMAVPTQLGVVPLYILFADLGWTGTIGAIIVPALYQRVRRVLDDAVPQPDVSRRADRGGARRRRVHAPHVLDGRAVAARPAGRRCCSCSPSSSAWNHFFWPLHRPRPPEPDAPGRAARRCSPNYFVDYSIVLAGVLLATIPLLILFVFAGKQLVSGIMAGAVKG